MKKKLPRVTSKGQLTFSVKNRKELVDYDYFDKLELEQLRQWLCAFNREYVNADFSHKYKKIHKKRSQKLEIYNANNRRNRDVFSQGKAYKTLIYCGRDMPNLTNENYSHDDYENFLNTLIDLKNQ